MQTIPQIDLQMLPESAQQEVYDFYLFVKQRIINKDQFQHNKIDIINQKTSSLDKLNSLKVESFTPLNRDEIYDR